MTDELIFQPGQAIPAIELDVRGGPVKAWSYSAITEFETCPHRIYLGKVKRIETEQHPAAKRGQDIHDLAEQFVTGQLGNVMPEALKQYEDDFDNLRFLYNENDVTCEEDWAFTTDWGITGWNDDNCWLRMKLDAFVTENATSSIVIDYKTGKKVGNELKHSGQAQLYAIGAFMRNPELQHVTTEFWYLDHKRDPLVKSYSRDHATLFLPKWNERGIAMTSCVDFLPRPSKFNCKWCAYEKNGSCEWSIT